MVTVVSAGSARWTATTTYRTTKKEQARGRKKAVHEITAPQRVREKKREREGEGERERDRQTDRQRQRERDRQKETDKEKERKKGETERQRRKRAQISESSVQHLEPKQEANTPEKDYELGPNRQTPLSHCVAGSPLTRKR